MHNICKTHTGLINSLQSLAQTLIHRYFGILSMNVVICTQRCQNEDFIIFLMIFCSKYDLKICFTNEVFFFLEIIILFFKYDCTKYKIFQQFL